MPAQVPARRAQRPANLLLTRALEIACALEAGQVDGGNEQDHGRTGQQQDHVGPHRSCHFIAVEVCPRAQCPVELRELDGGASHDGRQFLVGLLKGDVRLQPRHDPQEVCAAHAIAGIDGAQLPPIGVHSAEPGGRGRDAQHLIRYPVESHRLADDRGIGTEPRAPGSFVQDDDVAGRGAYRRLQAPENGANSEERKELRCHARQRHLLGPPEAGQIELAGALVEGRHGLERLKRRAPVAPPCGVAAVLERRPGKLLFEIAERELPFRRRHAQPRQPARHAGWPHTRARRRLCHEVSNWSSRPSTRTLNERYAWARALRPAGFNA